ncbi:MAG: hypothetical protein NXI30_19310 [bacterium]|nr:hypothetical protein [bacterium]
MDELAQQALVELKHDILLATVDPHANDENWSQVNYLIVLLDGAEVDCECQAIDGIERTERVAGFSNLSHQIGPRIEQGPHETADGSHVLVRTAKSAEILDRLFNADAGRRDLAEQEAHDVESIRQSISARAGALLQVPQFFRLNLGQNRVPSAKKGHHFILRVGWQRQERLEVADEEFRGLGSPEKS